MTPYEQIKNNLIIFQADMMLHYEAILQDFNFDKQGNAPILHNIGSEAAFLALMQVFLTDIETQIEALEDNAALLRALTDGEDPAAVSQNLIEKCYERLTGHAEDADFRQNALEAAQRESRHITKHHFLNAFPAVLSWIGDAVAEAQNIIQSHINDAAAQAKPAAPRPGGMG